MQTDLLPLSSNVKTLSTYCFMRLGKKFVRNMYPIHLLLYQQIVCEMKIKVIGAKNLSWAS